MSAGRLLEGEGGEEDGRNSGLLLDLFEEGEILLARSPDRVACESLLDTDDGQMIESDAGGRSL